LTSRRSSAKKFSKVNVPTAENEDEEKMIVEWEDDTMEQ